METHDKQFHPESVDADIDQFLQIDSQEEIDAQPSILLVHEMREMYLEESRVLDRARRRLSQQRQISSRETPASMQHYQAKKEKGLVWHGPDVHMSFSDAVRQTNTAQEQMINQTGMTRKERKVMEENTNSRGMNSLAPLRASKKRHSPVLKGVGVGLIAAVAVITIVSFTLFSGILRPAAPTASNGSSTAVGSIGQPQQQPQNEISSGKQVCSFASELASTNGAFWSPDPVWSSQGKIAVAAYSSFKAFSANNCAAAFSKPLQQTYGPIWSPDGKKVALVDWGEQSLSVLDNQGNTVAHLPFSQLGSDGVGDVMWSSDSSTLIFSSHLKLQSSIKSIAITSGGRPTTVMTLPSNSGVALVSPDGKYALLSHLDMAAKTKNLEVWDVNSGRKVSTLPSTTEHSLGWAFSPDGSLLAVGESNQMEIYSTADGKLQSSFSSAKASPGRELAWSPDGKYLAEGTNVINIYDVNAKKAVATFGQVDTHHTIFKLAWSPDSKGLVSSAGSIDDGNPPEATVSVWALS